MTPVYLCSLGTSVPEHSISQTDMFNAIDKNSELDRRSRLILRNIYNSSGIKKRHSVLDNFLSHALFSSKEEEIMPSISDRMRFFEKHALNLCKAAAEECLNKLANFDRKEITHIIAFSCTGMYAPGLDIEIIEHLELNPEAERTCINFMGCYAAINALKSAYHIVRSQPKAKVLLIGVELCSLHYRDSKDQEQIVANAIFSDGAAAALISADPMLKPSNSVQLELKSFYSDFFSSGKNEMVWSIGNNGFNLRLSAGIPSLLEEKASDFFGRLLNKLGMEKREIDFYAIHPGGIKILEACERALSLTKSDNLNSYEVLRQYGNMSSVTILFVLNEYLKSLSEADKGKKLVGCAFGPGITMESLIVEIA